MIAYHTHSQSTLPHTNSLARRQSTVNGSTSIYMYPTYDVLLVFGDSNTQFANDPVKNGFVAQLAEFYQRQMDVLNRGFRGYNASSARQVVNDVLPKTKINSGNATPLFNVPQSPLPDLSARAVQALWPYQKRNLPGISNVLRLLIIFFGTNDSRIPSSKAYNPIDQYAEDLKYMISLVQSQDSEHYSPDTKILIITPPVVGDRVIQQLAKSRNTEPEWYNNRTKTYADKAIEVAKAANVTYADLHTTMEDVVADYRKNISSTDELEGYDNYLIDGIHLNANGSTILFNLLHETIANTWPELIPLTSDPAPNTT
ncbi:isoamyl acetate-hydrolyzing esterase [Coemansia sp. RSA 2611]|nr:isoamyl acetate-hydrolyzing esterase [Coemansia sp. RSA 2611]KAJ2357728.1 isoamyl acetate-hydrolyzing esterase [Coemansia sp. RSA 2610]